MSAAADQAPAIGTLRRLLLRRAAELGIDGHEQARIEAVLEREVQVPSPTGQECRRHYQANLRDYGAGEMVEAAHILFAVTAGVDLQALRHQAEATLARLQSAPEGFERAAQQLSNCPSGREGGRLGQLGREDVLPEMRAVLFDSELTGIVPWLVRTRHGFHVVRVDHRIQGRTLPFDAVRGRIEVHLAGRAWEVAARHYAEMLRRQEGAGDGDVVSPLVQ